jgi:prepilin-type processing-associated H-X9-DG protein
MRGKYFNCSMVDGHVPTDTSDDKGMGGYLGALERNFDINPINHIIIILSDFNAQMGKEVVFTIHATC